MATTIAAVASADTSKSPSTVVAYRKDAEG